MAVSRVAVTTGAPATAAAFSPTLPSHSAGNRLILVVTGKYETTTVPTINQGWTLVGSGTGGTGTAGNDAGQTFWAVYAKDATSGSETAPTVTPGATAPNSWEWICSSHSSTGWADSIVASAGWVKAASDTTTASPLTGTAASFGSQPTAGDAIFCVGVIPTDLGSALGATTVTATGLSGGTVTAATTQYVENALGADSAAVWAGWTGFTGTASAGVAMSFTVTGATNQSGSLVAIALREGTPPPDDWTENATDSVGLSDNAQVSLNGQVPIEILVVHDDLGATADDTNLINFLTGRGHTVATALETASLPDTGYDVIIVTESGSSTSAAITSIPTCQLPVMLFETTWNTARLSTTAMVTGGTAGTTWDLTTHSLNTGYPDPLTVFTSSSSMYGVPNTDLASGVQVLAWANGSTTHATAVIADTGATLTSGTAPNRRAGMGLVTTRLSGMVAGVDSGNWFDDVVIWLANIPTGPDNWTVSATDSAGISDSVVAAQTHATSVSDSMALSDSASIGFLLSVTGGPDVMALSDSATAILSNDVLTADSAGLSDSTSMVLNMSHSVTDSVGLSDSSTVDLQSPVTYPVEIQPINTHVEAESHSYCPTIMDSNGNLYRITESQLAANNQPRAMKSTDNGATWAEMNAANRPGTDTGGIGDLESGWTTWDSTDKVITFTWQRSYVAYSSFRTSDHPTNPDTWVSNTRENMASLTGSPQYASHTSPTDQSYEWVFYNNSTTKPSYRSRTSSGVYGTQADVDSTGQHPASILDSANVSHILYRKATNELHYKKLTSAGTLDGTSTRVDTNNTHTVPIAHAAPQAWINAGTTYVGALFLNGSGHLKFVLITNGTPGAEETITTNVVVTDPGTTGNQGMVASLAVDPVDGTMHAMWVETVSGDVMHAQRPHGGSWSTPDTYQNPAFTASWVYCKVNTKPDTTRILSYTFSEAVSDDQNDIWYAQVTLSTLGPDNWTVSATDSAGLSDSATAAQTHAHTATDPAGLSDSATIGFTLVAPATDDAGLSDSAIVSLSHALSTTDSAGLGDSPTLSQGHAVSPTDSMGLSDSASSTLGMAVAASDQLGLSDSANVVVYRNIPIDVTDSMPLGDAALLSMEHVTAVQDVLGTSDTAIVAQGHGRSTVDPIGLSDSAVVSHGLGVTSSDPMGISDLVALAQGHGHALTDGVGLSDNATVTLAALLSVAAADVLGLSDSAAVVLFSLISHDTADIMGLADAIAIAVGHNLQVTDAVGLSDTVQAVFDARVSLSDTMDMIDSVSMAMNMPMTAVDLMALSDAAQVLLLAPLAVDVSEMVGLSDTWVVDLILPYTPASDAEASLVGDATGSLAHGGKAVLNTGSGHATMGQG